MGKNKSSSQQLKAAKSSKDAQVKAISSVKEGAITKPSQTPKSKSKEMAKVVASKADKVAKGEKKSKKAKKEPTPEPSSSEAESDEAVTSASSESSEDESEAEPLPAVVKSKGPKVNGSAKASAVVKADEESSESSSSSDDEDDDDIDDHKPIIPDPAPVVVKGNGVAKKHESSSEEDSEEDEEEDKEVDSEVDSEEESDAVSGAVDSKGLNGTLKKVEAHQSSDDENSDSEASSDSDANSNSEDSLGDESQEEAVASKKRKADVDPMPAVKKSKTEATDGGAAKKTLFVGQLSWNVDEDWLTREFEPCGELVSVRIMTDRNSGRSKGFGYVEFANSADAIKAQNEKHGASIDNRTINVDFSNPRPDESSGNKERSKTYGDQKSPPSDTIFVANIPFGATEDMLGEEFGKHGNVIGVRLPTNPEDGRPKGFGYVQFSSVDEASGALTNMEGAFIGGRPLRLDFSTPRSNTGDSPRGGRGGRGGGRGFDRGGRGGGRGRGGFGGDRGGGGRGGGRGGSTNRGGFGDFKGKKMTF